MGKAVVFRRKIGVPTPHGGMAGHVAWAFELPDQQGYYCGSTENLNSEPWHPVDGNNGFWAKQVDTFDEVLVQMSRRGYTDFKTQAFEVTDPSLARRVADNCEHVGYSFTGNNCVDHVYQILCHYGAADLLLPLEAPYPNGWFSAIAWEWHPMRSQESR